MRIHSLGLCAWTKPFSFHVYRKLVVSNKNTISWSLKEIDFRKLFDISVQITQVVQLRPIICNSIPCTRNNITKPTLLHPFWRGRGRPSMDSWVTNFYMILYVILDPGSLTSCDGTTLTQTLMLVFNNTQLSGCQTLFHPIYRVVIVKWTILKLNTTPRFIAGPTLNN